MTDELMTMGIFFVGLAIGSLNPFNSLLGWIIPMTIATVFVALSEYNSYQLWKWVENGNV